VQLHVGSRLVANKVREHPISSALARFQVKRSEYVTSQIHKLIKIDDPLSRRLVELLDGNHNEMAITHSLLEFVSTGQVELRENGALLTQPDQIEAAVKQRVPEVLKEFAREGLLVG